MQLQRFAKMTLAATVSNPETNEELTVNAVDGCS